MNTDPLTTNRSSSNYIKILNKCNTNNLRDYWSGLSQCSDLHSIDL